MKELSLHATLDAGHGDATPSDLCRWISCLATDGAGRTEAVAARLCRTFSEGELEIWLEEETEGMPDGVARYTRLCLRPHLVERGAYRSSSSTWRVEIGLLPPREVCTSLPLSRMALLGAFPEEVVADGCVLPYDALSPAQMCSMDAIYAVLTPRLASRLRYTLPAMPDCRRTGTPYERLMKETLRLLPLCFPRGGSADGCPLHLALLPSDVPAERLMHIGEACRLLRFGNAGTGIDPRTGLCRHGACSPGPLRHLRLTMVYPRGEREAACRMFEHFCSFPSLIALQTVGDPEEWVEYDEDDDAYSRITYALFGLYTSDVPPESRLYCLLLPAHRTGGRHREASLSLRLRSLVESFRSFYAGAFPLPAVGTPRMERLMPSLAARLLVATGGMPWVPLHFASQATDLIAGLSLSRASQGEVLYGAATFYNIPAHGCRFDVCRPESLFRLFFRASLRTAYKQFCLEHGQEAPRRLVVYCHCDQSAALLAGDGGKGMGYPDRLPVVWVQVRRTTKAQLRHYAPDAPGCLPPAGTVVAVGEGVYLLFCRPARPVGGEGAEVYPCPLELRLGRLSPDGCLQPLPVGEAAAVLVQAAQLVYADTAHVDGGALPLVLAHADRLARHTIPPWQRGNVAIWQPSVQGNAK